MATPAASRHQPSHPTLPSSTRNVCRAQAALLESRRIRFPPDPVSAATLACSSLRLEGERTGWRADGLLEKKKHDQNRKCIEGRVAFLSFSSCLESGDTTQVSLVDKISQGTTKVISVIGQSSSFKALYPVVQQQDRLSPPKILLGKGTKSKAVARRSQRT